MAKTIIKTEGPFNIPGGGKVYQVSEQISLQFNEIIEDPVPNIEQDLKGPECWIRKTWTRKLVDIQKYQIVSYQAVAKTNWKMWGGIALLVVATIATGGAAALVYASVGAAAGTAAALVAASTVAGGVGLAAGNKGIELVKNPDDYEIGNAVVGTQGPYEKHINVRPKNPRTEHSIFDCDRPITGGE